MGVSLEIAAAEEASKESCKDAVCAHPWAVWLVHPPLAGQADVQNLRSSFIAKRNLHAPNTCLQKTGTSEVLSKNGGHLGSDGTESACNVGDLGLIPGLGRSPAEGNSYPLQYSGLENSMDNSPWSRKELDVTK